MSELSPGETLLRDNKIVTNQSKPRQAVLRCIGCVWAKRRQQGNPPFVLATEIMSCENISTSASYGGVSTTLKKLRDLDIIDATKGSGEEYSKHTLLYQPSSNSFVGLLLEKVLRPVPECKTPLREPAKRAPLPLTGAKKSILYSPDQTIPGLVHALRDYRERLDLTKEEAASALGIERPKFAVQESTGKMTFDVFIRYAGFLGLEVSFRETGNGSAPNNPTTKPQEFTAPYPPADQ